MKRLISHVLSSQSTVHYLGGATGRWLLEGLTVRGALEDSALRDGGDATLDDEFGWARTLREWLTVGRRATGRAVLG
jgi:hypothetical protein